MDLPVSFLVAFVTPWMLASLVHYVDTMLSMTCFFAFTVAIQVAFANPFVFFTETVKESCYFETNFRLSVKQMYDGDRQSKKETSILPKTYKILETSGKEDGDTMYSHPMNLDSARNGGSTLDRSQMLAKTILDDPNQVNIPGSIKMVRYPTT